MNVRVRFSILRNKPSCFSYENYPEKINGSISIRTSYKRKQEGSYQNNQSQQLLQLYCALDHFFVVMLDFLWHNFPTAALTNTCSSCNLCHRSYLLFHALFTRDVCQNDRTRCKQYLNLLHVC